MAIIAIETLSLLCGRLSPRVFGMVMEWASEHQEELRQIWQLARAQEPLIKIDPLE